MIANLETFFRETLSDLHAESKFHTTFPDDVVFRQFDDAHNYSYSIWSRIESSECNTNFDDEDLFCFSEMGMAVFVVCLRMQAENLLDECSLPVAILNLTSNAALNI